MVSVRRLLPHEWQKYRDVRLESLKESPDAFGSTHDAEVRRPDSEWRRRVVLGTSTDRALPLVCEMEEGIAGLLWGRFNDEGTDEAHLYQMWVRPEARGKGIGSALLREAIDWARAQHASRLVLGVTSAESTAYRLYARAGFRDAGEDAPLCSESDSSCRKMVLDLSSLRADT